MKKQFRELRKDLHYFQMQARMDARNLKLSINKAKFIASLMRALQRDLNAKNPASSPHKRTR